MEKRKSKYTDGPIGKIKIVDDFLPPSKDLKLRGKTLESSKAKPKILKKSDIMDLKTQHL